MTSHAEESNDEPPSVKGSIVTEPKPIVLEDDEVLTTWGEVPEGWEATSFTDSPMWAPWRDGWMVQGTSICLARPVRLKVEIEARALEMLMIFAASGGIDPQGPSYAAAQKALES